MSAVGVSSKQRWAARREEGEGNWEAFLHYVAAPVLLFVLGASTNSRSGSNRARVRLKGRALVLGSRAALVLTFEGASQCRRWHLQPSRDRSHAEALGQPLANGRPLWASAGASLASRRRLLLCGLTNWTAEGQSWHCHGSPSEPMKDGDVRRALHSKVLAEHRDDPSTLVLDELGLWYGHARVDVAVVNGNIHGFEIKSERDTLERLPEQERIYSMVLDRVTLVVGTSHVSKAIPMVPEWWGVKVATTGPRGAVYFREERAPRGNPQQDPVALAMLLWCEELEAALIRAGMGRGFIGKKRRVQAARLASALSLEALRKVVCDALKARSEWTRAGVYAPAVACLAS